MKGPHGGSQLHPPQLLPAECTHLEHEPTQKSIMQNPPPQALALPTPQPPETLNPSHPGTAHWVEPGSSRDQLTRPSQKPGMPQRSRRVRPCAAPHASAPQQLQHSCGGGGGGAPPPTIPCSKGPNQPSTSASTHGPMLRWTQQPLHKQQARPPIPSQPAGVTAGAARCPRCAGGRWQPRQTRSGAGHRRRWACRAEPPGSAGPGTPRSRWPRCAWAGAPPLAAACMWG